MRNGGAIAEKIYARQVFLYWFLALIPYTQTHFSAHTCPVTSLNDSAATFVFPVHAARRANWTIRFMRVDLHAWMGGPGIYTIYTAYTVYTATIGA